MHTKINTVARFLISTFFIGDGIMLMHSYRAIDFLTDPFGSSIFFALGCMELLGGLFLLLGYKITAAITVLLISTLFTGLFLNNSLPLLLNELANAAGLILLLNNDAGETFWKYAQTDISNLPDYKVKM
jgi:uncharacterized membrane protein YphA (DoxX/SURF4 family)